MEAVLLATGFNILDCFFLIKSFFNLTQKFFMYNENYIFDLLILWIVINMTML